MGDDNTLQLNLIGTDRTGREAVPNGRGGVQIAGNSHNRIVAGGGTRTIFTIGDLFIGTVRTNVISGNDGPGVLIRRATASGNEVQGNWIGTDARGQTPLANDVGVEIREASGNSIGGAGLGDSNVISGNRREGVRIHRGATDNLVQGNAIGTEAFKSNVQVCTVSPTGACEPVIPQSLIAIPNGRDGILVEAGGNTIGGAEDGAGNLISSNGLDGVRLVGDDNLVQGNRIGTDALGTSAMANGRDGIRISGSNNTVGGAEAGEANVIAFNTSSGVRVASGVDNVISSNSTFANGGLGIDLGPPGVNGNDAPHDADRGANNLQNSPEIITTRQNDTHLQIIFHIPSQPPNSAFPMLAEFFLADDDGETFLASTEVALFTPAVISIPLADIPAGAKIVAAATDANGNTSEFSAPLSVDPSQTSGTDEAAADLVFLDLGE